MQTHKQAIRRKDLPHRGATTCLGLPSGPTDDIDGEPPRAQNTPVCTGTCPLDLDPQAARNGGYLRACADQRLLRTVTRFLARYRSERRLCTPVLSGRSWDSDAHISHSRVFSRRQGGVQSAAGSIGAAVSVPSVPAWRGREHGIAAPKNSAISSECPSLWQSRKARH